MSTNQLRLPAPGASRAVQAVGAFAKELYRNVAAIVDIVLHARSVQQNVQKMADMLREADRLQATQPARAAELREAARTLFLA